MDVDAISAISCGMRRQVIASMDIPLADSCQMSDPERTIMGASAPRVGGMVILQLRLIDAAGMLPSGSAVRRQKCLQIGQVTEVDVCPWAAFGFPCAMQRKQDGGQLHPWPLCRSLRGQLK